MMNLGLRPCPFCGETLNLKILSFPDESYVQCQCCTTTGPNGVDVECAVLQWNQNERKDEKLEIAREALKYVVFMFQSNKEAVPIDLWAAEARAQLALSVIGEDS